MTLAYLKRLAEDAVTSFAAGALSVVGLDVVNVWTVDWKLVVGVGSGAALVGVLKGLAAKPVGNPETTSFVK